jgi:hypothetical protein
MINNFFVLPNFDYNKCLVSKGDIEVDLKMKPDSKKIVMFAKKEIKE